MIGSNGTHNRQLSGKRYKSLPTGRSASDVLSRDRKREPQSLAALIEEMENDYQISFSKEILAAHIQAVNVSIACESPDARAKLLTEHLQLLWRETLPRMIDSISFGRVAFEKENEYNADANLHFTRTLADLPFKKTELVLTDDGDFDGIKLTTRGEIFHIEPSKSWWLSLDETVLEPHGKSRYLGAPHAEWKKRRTVFEIQEKMLKKFALRGGVARGPSQVEDESGNLTDTADILESAMQHYVVGGLLYLPGEKDQAGNYPIEWTEPPTLMDPSPLDNVLDKSDVRVLRSFGISELAVSQTADVGSFAMAVMHRLVLMSVVQGILQQYVNSYKRYVIEKHIEWNFLEEDQISITMTFPNLTDLPDSLIVEFAAGVLQSPTLSPLVTSGAIDLKQILESVGVPVAADLEARLKVAFEEAKKAAAAPPPGGGSPFGGMANSQAPNIPGNIPPRMKSLTNRLIGDSLVPSREELVDEAMSELDRLYGRFIQALETQRETGQRNDMELREILETIQELEADVTTASRILGMASLWEPAVADNPPGSGVRQAKASEPGERFMAIGSVTGGSPLDQPANPSAWRFPWVDRAIQWLKEKAVATTEEIKRIARRDRTEVFSAAGQNNLATVADLQQEVANSLVTGESLEVFRERVEAKLQESGLARYQVETIYRTNTHQAYVEAQNETLRKPVVKEQFPYVYYSATADNRVRDHHWDLDGMIAEVDSPLHELFMAALADFNCRCTAIPMTEEQASARIISTLEDASWDSRRFYGMSNLQNIPGGLGVLLARLRAPKGGAIVNAKPFKGGQYIPTSDLSQINPGEKAVLKEKLGLPVSAAEKAAAKKAPPVARKQRAREPKAASEPSDSTDSPKPEKSTAKKYKNGNEAEKDLAPSSSQWAEDPSDYFGNRAVKAYAGTSDSFRINDCLRKNCGDAQLTAKADALAEVLDKTAFPKDVEVYRSINVKTDAEKAALMANFQANLGKSFTDNAFVSTTANAKYADEWAKKFGGNVINVKVKVPKGAKAAYLPKDVVGKQEWEVLVQRGAKYKVVSIEGNNVQLELEP